MPRNIGVRPGKDSSLSKRWQAFKVSVAAPLGQQLSQGGFSRQPAIASPQGHVDVVPLLTDGVVNEARMSLRPPAGPLVIEIGPDEDL